VLLLLEHEYENLFYSLILFIFFPVSIEVENKINLEDIDIKGQLHNTERLNFLSREQNGLKNYIKFRTNFSKEIIEELPEPAPGVAKRKSDQDQN